MGFQILYCAQLSFTQPVFSNLFFLPCSHTLSFYLSHSSSNYCLLFLYLSPSFSLSLFPSLSPPPLSIHPAFSPYLSPSPSPSLFLSPSLLLPSLPLSAVSRSQRRTLS